MSKISKTFLTSFIFTTGVLLFFLVKPHNAFAQACQGPEDCDGATCNTQTGNCTGGGTECGFGPAAQCPAGYTCVNGNCVGGTGPGPGGSVCTGCYPDQNQRGVWPVVNATVSQASPTSAILNWTYGVGFACSDRSSVSVFVGRSKDVVDADCGWNGGSVDPLPTNPQDIEGQAAIPGLGGGGDGAWFDVTPAQAGTANTGGGGGGGVWCQFKWSWR